MDKFDRIFQLDQLLNSHRCPLSLNTLQDKMECSESTARRMIGTLRDTLGAPIEYDREQNGYYYDVTQGQTWELPGLWFNAQELYALLVSYNLLDQLQPGMLSDHIQPLKQRIESILQQSHAGGSPDLSKRIRIFQQGARPANLDHFRQIASATLQRRQIRLLYHGRERDQTTERTVSPQRLVYYRSNWYLDAWCHLRKEFRTFSLDRLSPVEMQQVAAREISEESLDEHFAHAYGIFAGQPTHSAKLRFTSEVARWVADEHWHPQQQGKVLTDGGYELSIPYSDTRELIMDIMKYGPDVEVISPDTLRKLHIEKLASAINNYKNGK
ncbi:MAG: YafY family transcriptional regulator [Gammaproteobacteria bacterium]|nr:YafY family transcriptional regulator [Gammaproteobacteria bacterium]MCF6259849.1 YafY family transcriptional regulator [Gammaproteobacteria bacterium]